MPGGDGTGPAGMGPMTGRATGYCVGYAVPGYLNPAFGGVNPALGRGYFGRGRGFIGRGSGRGRRNWFHATGLPGSARFGMGLPAWGGSGPYMDAYPYAPELNPQQEADMLKSEAGVLKQQLEDIQSRISTLEKEQAQESK